MNSFAQRTYSVFKMTAVITLFIGALMCSSPGNAGSRETSSVGFNINQAAPTQLAHYYRYYHRPYYRYHYYRHNHWNYHRHYYRHYYYRR